MDQDLPIGATAVVFRRVSDSTEYLFLHRAHRGPSYTGDWAWGPPGGLRDPGEEAVACALRELWEETGLKIDVRAVSYTSSEWALFVGELKGAASIVLSHEHDRYVWAQREEALETVSPAVVVQQLHEVMRVVEQSLTVFWTEPG